MVADSASKPGRLVLVDDIDAVRTITLNRPDVLNALNRDLLAALEAAVATAAGDDTVRAVVITGAGRGFCTGQDLAELAGHHRRGDAVDLGDHLCSAYHPVILTIRRMAKPVIAAVNGPAIGAGCSLALACDLRVAAASASFMASFINIALVPGSGCTFMLPRLVGLGRAAEMTLTGRKVGAAEALQIGLVNQVVPDEELRAASGNLARSLAEKSAPVLAMIKDAINRSWSSDLETQLKLEEDYQARAGETRDHHEAIRAFMEKRPPQIDHR
jgi:2-(1,2-epoxy-1,2-dihydrophenyl)acetyl-CoA isomerase